MSLSDDAFVQLSGLNKPDATENNSKLQSGSRGRGRLKLGNPRHFQAHTPTIGCGQLEIAGILFRQWKADLVEEN